MQALDVPATLEAVFHQLALHGTADSDSLFLISLWANRGSRMFCDA